MEDAEGLSSVQDDAEVQEVHRTGTRTARQARRKLPLWQWNTFHEGGPYNPSRIAFSGNEGNSNTSTCKCNSR